MEIIAPMNRSTPSPLLVWMSGSLALSIALPLAVALLPLPARAAGAQPTTVVLLGLRFQGQVPPPVQKAMAEKLAAGLIAARVQIADQAAVARAIGNRGACHEPACWKSVAVALGCRYAVGGKVTGEDGSYEIELFIGDAFSGTDAKRIPDRCVVCGLTAAAEKVDLMASQLVAALEAATRAPARVMVQTAPPGAMVSVDGDEVGLSPREVELSPGPHTIAAKTAGYAVATRSVTAVAGVEERIELQLLHLGSSSSGRALGWVGLAAGVAAIGAGIALLAIDGQAITCASGQPDFCERRETTAGGAVLVGVGAAVAGLGGYLIYRARTGRSNTARRAVRLARGATLSLSF